MWKDFFYFSKGQRIGIIILIVLILLTLAINILLPYFFKHTEPSNKDFIVEVEQFRKSLVSVDSLQQLAWEQKYENRFQQNKSFTKNSETDSYSLFVFNPNKADSITFVSLGLKTFVASNILKYRAKGGLFKTKESFGKVYGISPEKFKELEPYINIPEIQQTSADTIKPKFNTPEKIITIELNSADTTELMKIKGIGRFYAKGIVRFRMQTGGFTSKDQLNEIYGMTPANFEKIYPLCTVNASLVQKINVNTATVQRLNTHPYLDYYQSKAIYELRRKKGKLRKIDDLNELTEISPETSKKIQPYLSFE